MIIFGKFGDGQSEWNGSGPVSPTTGREIDRVRSLQSRISSAYPRVATTTDRNPGYRRSFSVRIAPPSALLIPARSLVLPRGTRVAVRGSRPLAPFLPGSAQKAECDVTSTKQTTGEFLPGATTGCRRLVFRRSFFYSSEFLTGSASQTEFDVTRRKQTAKKFLTGARTAISHLAIWRTLR